MVKDLHDTFLVARRRMVQEQLRERGVVTERVLDIMTQIPRHRFVDEALKAQAYSDAPLSIGEGQTISQPFIVGLMTQALALTGVENVLEIGTGCGYQTAILSYLAAKVCTIERLKSLGMFARQRFRELKLSNVMMRIGDGSLGWIEQAPFDRILLTCAAPLVPDVFIEQLCEGGYLILPVETSKDRQELLKLTRTTTGVKTENLGLCRFVKLVGKNGFAKDEF